MIFFDIETDNLRGKVKTIHLICLCEDDGDVEVYHDDPSLPRDGSISQGVQQLNGKALTGHNILGYDLPVLSDLGKPVSPSDTCDTLCLTGLIYPGDDLKIRDYRNPDVPGKMKGRRSLESWGYRLGNPKGDFHDFRELTPEMIDYGIQDVEVTRDLYHFLQKRDFSREAYQTEQAFFGHLADMMVVGVHVDEAALESLTATLMTAAAACAEKLQQFFPPVDVPEILEPLDDFMKRQKEAKYPKRLRRKTLQKAGQQVFNPNSRLQIIERLQSQYGWVHNPKEVTPTGRPEVNETVLSKLDYDCIPDLVEYLMIQKKLGQVATGDKSWVDSVEDGKIYGYINHQGTVTGRCAHSRPNLGQVPRVGKPFGADCRRVFIPRPGWALTGCDAAGLELRMLSHFTTPYDDGAFRDSVLGGDPHTANMKALGITNRDQAKTWFYAWIYGATDGKLAKVLGTTKAGATLARERFEKGVPGLGKLRASLERELVNKGMAHYEIKWGKKQLQLNKGAFLRTLQDRKVPARSPHSLLNALNQSAGAVLVKVATNLFHDMMAEQGYQKQEDYNMVLHVHDEYQIEHRVELGETVRNTAMEAFRRAGVELDLNCPMAGDAKTGKNWSETH